MLHPSIRFAIRYRRRGRVLTVQGRARAWKRRLREEWMDKPRIFLGSSGKQSKLLQALTRGLEDIAHVGTRPSWTGRGRS